VVVPVVVHLVDRFRLPKRTDFSRRAALEYAALAGGGVLAWRAQRAVARARGATGRFTGSYDAGGEGNDFPVTSWVADDPDPVEPGAWRLRVEGAVAEPLELRYADVDAAASEQATHDCTSGWYADREWGGVRVGDLLDRANAAESARYVSFQSVTGYRWSLPVEEARAALLATAVGGEQLTHGHGFPARLVAPGRRGFQWVKWVERVEVHEAPDYGQWVAIFTSGFD
jgi:DMSO/TMAO reductase YedYZ molybdopterin-dependent catalytic subunit